MLILLIFVQFNVKEFPEYLFQTFEILFDFKSRKVSDICLSLKFKVLVHPGY